MIYSIDILEHEFNWFTLKELFRLRDICIELRKMGIGSQILLGHINKRIGELTND